MTVPCVLTDGVNTVATSSLIGHIAVWSLDDRRLVTMVKDAHDGSVGGMEFIQSQPLMATSSVDNSVKVIIIHVHFTTVGSITVLVQVFEECLFCKSHKLIIFAIFEGLLA